jgi:hypothetical protein
MHAFLICVAAVTLGWQTGYRQLPGGTEYIIRLDSASIEAMRDGQPIESYIPSSIGEVRSFRIIMGKGGLPIELPRELPKNPPPLKLAPPKPVELPALTPKAAEKPAPTPTPEEKPAEPKLPWVLLLLGLFASIGANLFLGWIAWGLRRRCQNAA